MDCSIDPRDEALLDEECGPDICIEADEVSGHDQERRMSQAKEDSIAELPLSTEPISQYDWSDTFAAVEINITIPGLDEVPDSALLVETELTSAASRSGAGGGSGYLPVGGTENLLVAPQAGKCFRFTVLGVGTPPVRRCLVLARLFADIQNAALERRRGNDSVVLKLRKVSGGPWPHLTAADLLF
eukprot:TRINITY_DN29911_c0_g2_i1.p2 TRINITY_DN29911_c0_g2~~TRINITY_DN29911_c0_g2_i1.p2  ORF type:complete len:186 (+),score=17.18 TRINITY_DN29911_c0_g2_i1:87-644(+)